MLLRTTCVFVLTALVFAAPSAQAAFPGANGKIAFVGHSDGDAEIYTVNADGSAPTKLTNNQAHETKPQWSPDGSKIAFVSDRDSTCGQVLCSTDIYVMNGNGTAQVRLTFLSGDPQASSPVWSPDGSKIAFARTDIWDPGTGEYAQESELYVVPSSGGAPLQLTHSPQPCADGADPPCGPRSFKHDLAWAPDGSRIVFANSDNEWFFECDNGGCWSLGDDSYKQADSVTGAQSFLRSLYSFWPAPVFSPDGSRIALGERMISPQQQEIFVISADGSGGLNVTNHPQDDIEAAWSPDGTKIAFTRAGPGSGLYVMNPDGTGQTPIPNGVGGNQADWQPLGALDPYPRPGGGSPQRVPLVPSYQKCTAPNSQHVEPLDEPSCTPPALTSQVLTTGTAGRGQGSARLDAIQGDPGTPTDEADLRITASASDVRCKQANAACPSGAGSDFTGKLLLSVSARITDRASGFGGVSATASDTKLQAPLTCTASPDATLGASCTTTTSADALIPGYVKETKRTVFSSLRVTLDDPGFNGTGYGPSCPPTCGDGDEAPYLEQGVFIGL